MKTRHDETKNRLAGIALATALVFALSGLVGAWCAPPDGGSDRMARKMSVLEKIFDEVLRESPSVFISGDDVTRGLLLDGYGALFTFDGSLIGGGLGYFALGNRNGPFGLSRSQWTVPAPAPPPKAPKALKGGEEETRVPDSMEELAETWNVRREENAKMARENLAGLKAELTETLLDYGATLGELTDDQWVVVAAFLGGFEGEGPDQLVLKVKMRDLRQYSAGQLSLDQAKKKVTIQEQ